LTRFLFTKKTHLNVLSKTFSISRLIGKVQMLIKYAETEAERMKAFEKYFSEFSIPANLL